MRLTSIRLEDLFCYQDVSVEFSQGVSVFAGPNGSGKSSLMEGIFFALYGSGIKPISGREMVEVLREGASRGTVMLEFSLGNHSYKVQMVLKRSGEKVTADGDHCILSRDDDQTWVKVKEVTGQIQNLLGMSAEDFANCLYVRQGEVDRLIKATPAERQSDMDRLLRLTLLDDYDRRVRDGVIRALNRCKDRLQGQMDDRKQELGVLKERDLPGEEAMLKRRLAELQTQQQQASQSGQALEQELLSLTQRIDQYADLQERHREYSAHVETLTNQLEQRASTEEGIRRKIREAQEILNVNEDQVQESQNDPLWTELELASEPSLATLATQLEQQRESLVQLQVKRLGHEGELERAQGEIDSLRTTQEETTKAVDSLKSDVVQRLEEAGIDVSGGLEQLDLGQLRGNVAQAVAQAQERYQALRLKQTQLQEQQDAVAQELEKIEQLVDEGRCPTCHQPVTAATVQDHTGPLRDRRANLQSERGVVNEALSQADQEQLRQIETQKVLADLETKFRKWSEQRERSVSLESGLVQLVERAEMLAGELQVLCQAVSQEQLEAVKAREAFVDKLERLKADAAVYGERVQGLRNQLRESSQNSDRLRQDLTTYGEAGEQLEAQLKQGNVDALQAQQEMKLAEQAELQGRKGELSQNRDTCQQQLGRLEEELSRQSKLQQEATALVQKLQTLNRLADEVEELRGLYAKIKVSQRQKNLHALNAIFNHFFKLMDSGATYDRVQLDDAYNIEILLNDGTSLSPLLLSGGERALVNLALRAAMHRVICEAGGVLLPLFFDEPTVFLDEGRIRRLEQLFEELGREVGQVVVVSHEASLVESADHEYRVEKDADNVGHVEKVR